MHIAWGSLGIVFVVSFAAAVAVAALVAFALVSFSPKTTMNPVSSDGGAGAAVTASGKVVGGLCLAAAGLIVLYGLYVIVAA